MTELEFNINEIIKVKLYDKGYQVLVDNHNSYLGIIKSFDRRDIDYYKSQADENGYTEFQMWGFMNIFGKYIQLGKTGYFNYNIIIITQ